MEREKLLLIPGPTPVHPRIIHVLSQPTVSHVGTVMVEEMAEALDNLKKIVYCREGQPFIVSGAGTLAMEMAVVNTSAPGDRVLAVSQGYFGARAAEICKSFGIDCDLLESEWGAVVSPGELRDKLGSADYKTVFCTHVDTATGACAPVREYARVVQDSGALFIIDGVCATGGIEENMDAWGVDGVLTAAQKCFGVPPGLAVLVLSQKAMIRRRDLGAVPAYYSDVMRWLPVMQDPSRYFSTPCVNEIRAFNEGTKIILEEGLKIRFIRHRKIGMAVRAALRALGFPLFSRDDCRADTLTVALYPEGVEDRAFRAAMFENGIVVAGGLGPTAGRVFRMGHMGNLSFSQIEFAVEALETSLQSLGYGIQSGAGVDAARENLRRSTD